MTTKENGLLHLRGAEMVDGTGTPPVTADVEVRDGRITKVGRLESDPDATVIDLDGLVLAPGFIDIHTHFDCQIFWDPTFSPSCWHGVTSVVQGNCGFGIAPTRPGDRNNIMETLEHVEGMNLETLRSGIEWSFESFPEYLGAISRRPKVMNVGTLIGHTPLRLYVMGLEAATSRTATDEEVSAMSGLLEQALNQGAVGFSTSRAPNHIGVKGLPVPSRLADRNELAALLRTVGRSNRIAELTFGPDLDLDETNRVARDLDVRITWGSLLTGMFGPPGTAVNMLEQASGIGGDVWPQVSCRPIVLEISMEDPYFLGQVPAFQEVFAVSREERRRIYEDPGWRERARGDVENYRRGFYRKTSIAETQVHSTLVGVPLSEMAQEQGVDPLDVMVDLALREDLHTRFRVNVHNDDEDELGILLRDRRTLLGVHDAGAHVDMLCDACFPTHLLGHWVRDKGVLSLHEAIWKLTGQPADVFRIAERGTIKVGNWADLVAFDPKTIAALPTQRVWDFPAGGDRLIAGSEGVEAVWVNGEAIREHGKEVKTAAPGMLLT